MSINKCCEAGSLIAVLASGLGTALNVLPPLVAIVAGSLSGYYYFLQIRKERKRD